MRAPEDLPRTRPARRPGRRRWWLIGAIAVVVVILASLKSLATLYTDSLWFSSVHQHRVWSTLLGVKVGLFLSFFFVFFVVLWANLIACDRLAGPPAADAEDELVRRYQQAVRPYAARVYAAIAVVLALIAASGTIGEWQNWILFRNAQSFHRTDPQFGRDLGYFIFKLPFETFVVNWVLVSLIVMLVVTIVFHYLNGGIRAQRVSPRVRPAVKAHLSLLLAIIALAKAAAYYLQRFSLDNAQDGYVSGAGYTDVHARLPAYDLLIFVSLGVAVLLLINIRRQGWTFPVIAVGVWAFVALVVGVIYPAILQAVRVTPNQVTLEKPYIDRNISATRRAYGLTDVAQKSISGTSAAGSSLSSGDDTTLQNIRLWDPSPLIALPTFQRQQDLRQYYTFQQVAVDRYDIKGKETPVIIGVRQVDPSEVSNPSWVNTHLVYTHGEGAAVAVASTDSGGYPVYSVKGVPPTSTSGLPTITQPDVYFGLDDPGYVVADTKQPELDYSLPNGTNQTTSYNGGGGVRIGSFLTQAAFALRLGDFNLLVSNQITDHSRMLFVRDVQAMAEKAAPFLSYDHDPYAAIVNGHLDWILDAYTTTAYYPYSQNADTLSLPLDNNLPVSFNYVRNSVKVVVDAYTGKMTFYDMDPSDPILRAYAQAFPGLFTPASQMPTQLRDHLRYPEDIFEAQAAVYGRYHLTTEQAFYDGANAWSVSVTEGTAQTITLSETENAQGQIVTGPPVPMSPLYQVFQQPFTDRQSFAEVDAYVPNLVTNPNAQNLTGYLVADSDPGQYGRLTVYETPTGTSIYGPAQAESNMDANQAVSSKLSLLDQHGSQVILGNILVVPLGQSVLYVRPLYTTSANSQPQLDYVITEYQGKVGFETTLAAALADVGLHPGTSTSPSTTPTTPTSPTTSSSSEAAAQQQLQRAASDYQQAENALKLGDLGTYGTDIQAMDNAVAAAQQDLGASASGATTTPATGSAPTATTTTTTPRTKAGKGSGPSTTKATKSSGSSSTKASDSGEA